MKYIEQVKSILLTFLVLFSIVFTLLIWNYKPDYGLIEEEKQIEEVLVGQPKELHDVLKPYRLLYRQNDEFTGTVSPSVLNELYSYLQTWETNELDLIKNKNNLSDENMNEMIRINNRVTMFFNEEIPFQVFSNVVSFNDKDLPEASFTRLILDWSTVETNNQLELLFLNTEKRVLFRGYTNLRNTEKFLAEVIRPAEDYSPYVEVERDSLRSLYVPQNPIQSTRYTYLVEDINAGLFKTIVFTNPKIVKPNVESEQSVRYTDSTSFMTVDTKNRILNYVYPPAESITPIPSYKLLIDSFNYINDHGGFTEDFRFSSMNIGKHKIEYRLFLHGLPVNSDRTSTRIETTWGENRIFRYRRPFYSLATATEVNREREQKELVSGEEVIEYIRNSKDYSFKDIDEIVVGYSFTQNEAFILEPSWFAISNNEWTRITPERTGGIIDGLE